MFLATCGVESKGGMRKSIVVLLGACVVFASSTLATAAISPCTPQISDGAICEIDLALLRPTQFGVGLLQVSDEMRKLKRKTPGGVRKAALKKRIAVVIGPKGDMWLVDRHHFSRALWELGVRRVPVSIIGRIDQHDDFWQAMKASNWAWLYDERGNPRDPADLPQKINELPDYSYRSLAGFAEDLHLFNKPEKGFFVEFSWAKYFGDQLNWVPVTAENLSQRLDQARRVACQPTAAALPGYPGAACGK